MEPLEIIKKYYNPNSKLYSILVKHSSSVTGKALELAGKMKNKEVDIQFIKEAAMLHDIGIYLVSNSKIGCNGKLPYVCHGFLGAEILRKEGFPKHALVCERHVGVGISKEEIKQRNLPLPEKDMVPISIEEKLICFADKFFSKTEDTKEFSLEEIKENILPYGEDSLKRFEEMCNLFL